MKNRLLGFIFILVIMFGLTGCGSSSNDNGSNNENSKKNDNNIELYPVKVEEMADYRGRYGYVDKNGKWVIEPQYISAGGFDPVTGLAKVRNPKGDYAVGFINTKGEMVIDGCGSYDTRSFKNGYAVVDTNVRVKTYSTKKLIDKDGKTIIDAGKYEIMSDVSKDGILMVSEDTISTVKFIKLDGTIVYESKAENFHNCSGFNSKGYGYCGNTLFNVDGNENRYTTGKIQNLNDNNYGFVENNDYYNSIYTIKDGKIEVISDYKYKSTTGFNDDNYAMVREDSNKPYYLINEGEKVNDNTYASVQLLTDGKWVVKLDDGKHQVLSSNGDIIVNTF